MAELCGIILSPVRSAGPSRPATSPTASKPVKAPGRPPEEPSGLPPADALFLVDKAAHRLGEPEGRQALAYLHSRGLNDETIKVARLGETPGVMVPTRLGDRYFRVGGIVIPWFDGDRLALVKIRQRKGREPKYVQVYRDRPAIFPGSKAIFPGRPLVIVEGEFDALLLVQELRDLAAIVTLGSASSRPDPGILAAVICPPRRGIWR